MAQIGNLEEATYLIKTSLSFRTPVLRAYKYLGDYLKLLGKKEEAIYAYEKAREYLPFSFEVFISLVSLYKEFGRQSDLGRMLKELNKYGKKWAKMMESDGFSFLYEGDIDSAMKCFLSATLLDERRDKAYYGLSLIYYSKGDLKKSLEAIEKAIEIDPDNKNYRKSREKILMEMGDEIYKERE
jgi:superkiller protein 3